MTQLQKAFKILYSPKEKMISVSEIQKELRCSQEEAIKLFKELQVQGNYSIYPYYGEYGEEKKTVEEWLPTQDQDEPMFKIPGTLSKEEQDRLNCYNIAENTIKNIKQIWEENRIIWYGIIDICNSEKLQEKSDEEYNDILLSLENKIREADNKSGYQYKYFLGEIGDAFKVVITEKDKIIKFITNLAHNLDNILHLSCSFFALKLGEKSRVDKYFRKTIAGIWDINSETITKAFRIDNNKKIDKTKEFKIIALLDEDIIDTDITNEDYIKISHNKDNQEDTNPRRMYPIVYKQDNTEIRGKETMQFFIS